MRIVGIILNVLGIIILFVLVVNYFSNLHTMTEHLNSVAINGRDDGPTSIFYTAKISRTLLILLSGLLSIFLFNVIAFIWKGGHK